MGWLVPANLAMLAQAYLAVIRHQATDMTGRKGGYFGLDEELIPLTVPEVRRLLTRLVWTATA